MSKRHFPAKGDKVNDSRRMPHANGFVQRVMYADGPEEVIVNFDDKVEIYDFSEFEFSWTDKYGGAFILAEEKHC